MCGHWTVGVVIGLIDVVVIELVCGYGTNKQEKLNIIPHPYLAT